MDLNKKLNMLSGVSSSGYNADEELSGISAREDENDEEIDLTFDSLSIDSYLRDSGYKKSKKKNKKKSSSFAQSLFEDVGLSSSRTGNSKLDKITETTKKLVESANLASAEEFDDFLDDEDLFTAEENAEMRNHLTSLGRKYARDSASSKESSEITKTFADSEKRLKALYEELDRDKGSLQKDIERMRVPGRGGKSLADLVSVKTSMQNTQLAIVKEVNALRKNIFEMRNKEAARKEAENAGNSDISANTLQSIFSSARSNLVNSMGGYAGVSGARDDDSDDYMDNFVSDGMEDEEIQKRYFRDSVSDGSTDEDGDKFLEYENRGVEYVLLVDEDNKVQGVLAEDKDGIMIPDYPLPNNLDMLNFEIDHTAKMATDNMHRNYHVRRVDD